MRVDIDWLSFTVPIYSGAENIEGFALRVENGFYDMLGKELTDALFGGKWEERKGGRAPYSNSYDIPLSDSVAFLNPVVNNVLVELSGQACQKVREMGHEHSLLEKAQTRATRLDVAVDMETDTQPVEFAPKAQYASTKSYAENNSKTGQTVYIGSSNSERFTRVYRYVKPHPRSKYLRVEFVFRRKVARAVIGEILVQGKMAVVAFYGDKENFLHRDWLPTDRAEGFTTYESTARSDAKTLVWLGNSVAPAVRRLIREGVIKDPERWLLSTFMPQ